jgi:hypothetical protein
MTTEQIAECLQQRKHVTPDIIIVASLEADINAALAADPNRPGQDIAVEVYNRHLEQFESPSAARNAALSKIREFRERAEEAKEAEFRLHHARTRQDEIAQSVARRENIKQNIVHLDCLLSEVKKELTACSPEAVESLIEAAAEHYTDAQPATHGGFPDVFAAARHNKVLEILVAVEQRKLILNRVISKVTDKREVLKEEVAQLTKLIEGGARQIRRSATIYTFTTRQNEYQTTNRRPFSKLSGLEKAVAAHRAANGK